MPNPRGHPATLKPPWKKGQSGNPAGRRTLGASIVEWLNALAERSRPEIQAALEDDSAPMTQRIAAARLLSSMIDGADFDRMIDRTVGKPNQSLNVTGDLQLTQFTVEFPPLPDEPLPDEQ